MLYRHVTGRAFVLALVWCVMISFGVAAQKKPLSPSDTVAAFYKLLREQKYKEGFALSVYREAIDGLSEDDLRELAPEFRETFTDIPEKLTVQGEQVSGDLATVFVQFGAESDVQEVALIKIDGRWIVGDQEALGQVRRELTAFFFNTRIRINENETFKLLKQIIGTQGVYFQKYKGYATLEELQRKEGLLDDFRNSAAFGYKFLVNLTPDRQGYTVIAYPERYRRTGTLSFFADGRNIHGADANGLPVNEQAPLLVPDAMEPPRAQ